MMKAFISSTVILVSTLVQQTAGLGAWKKGRATFFGADGWSIHEGNCGLGFQFENIYPGFDVAAISDKSGEFSQSCGKCFEISCKNEVITDGYGQQIDLTGSCFDESKSLVVRIVDACPCQYASNAYSNKRWCCQDNGAGDMHTDLSVWAFERLARKRFGVMALRYREVPCNYYPENPAKDAENPTPYDYPPKQARKPHEKVYVKRTDPRGVAQGAIYTVDDESEVYDKSSIVSPKNLYRDGTYALSYGGDFSFTGSASATPVPSSGKEADGNENSNNNDQEDQNKVVYLNAKS
jgi:hypothetical protein